MRKLVPLPMVRYVFMKLSFCVVCDSLFIPSLWSSFLTWKLSPWVKKLTLIHPNHLHLLRLNPFMLFPRCALWRKVILIILGKDSNSWREPFLDYLTQMKKLVPLPIVRYAFVKLSFCVVHDSLFIPSLWSSFLPKIALGQLMPNSWRIIISFMSIWVSILEGDMIKLN